jgi:hypothetical protein
MSDKQSHGWLLYSDVDKADADYLAKRPVIIEEGRTMRTIEKIENDKSVMSGKTVVVVSRTMRWQE